MSEISDVCKNKKNQLSIYLEHGRTSGEKQKNHSCTSWTELLQSPQPSVLTGKSEPPSKDKNQIHLQWRR